METAPTEHGLLRGKLRALQLVYGAQTYTIVLARVLAYSWLLREMGSGRLPWVFVAQAVPLCVLTFALIGVVDRVGRASLILAGSGVTAGGVVLIYAGARLGLEGLSPVFLLFGETIFSLFGVHFWLLTSELLSPTESKRHFPSLALVGALGAILAGLTAQFLGGRPPQNVLWLLLLPVLVSGVGSWHIHRNYRYRVGPGRTGVGRRGWTGELIQGLGFLKQSSFLRWLILLTAGITSAGVIVDYVYSVTAEQAGVAERLPAFFGGINVVINVLQILLVLVVGRRIFMTAGLFRTLTTFPVGGAVLGVATLAHGIGWPAVALKVFDRLENYLVLNPGVGIALNAFDRERRGRASLVYGGLVKPLSISLAGLCLLRAGDPIHATVLLLAVFAIMLLVLRSLGRAYRKALMDNLRSTDSRLVRNSLEALSEPENRGIVPELIAFYRRVDDPVFEENVLKAAGRIRDPAFIPILLDALRGRHTSLKCAAVRSLAQFPTPEVQEALLSALKNEDSDRVKASILSALTDRFETAVHYPVLLAGLEDPDPRVRANAVEAIGLTRDPDLVARVRPCLESKHPRIRANAVVALAGVPEYRPEAVRALRRFLETGDRPLLLSALHAAGEVKDPGLLGRVREAARSTDPDIRRNAVIALGKYDDPGAVEPLARLLVDSSRAGIPVAYALDRLGEGVREALIDRVSRLSDAERVSVLRTIKACGVNYPELIDQLEASGHGEWESLPVGGEEVRAL